MSTASAESNRTDRSLRLVVARLARLSDADIRGVMSHLSDEEAQAVQALLVQAGAAATAVDWSRVPAWALDRIGGRVQGRMGAPRLRRLLWRMRARPARITEHAMTVLEQLALERAQGGTR
jgi:hypothetical protein